MNKFVILNKLEGDKEYGYSIVNEEILKTIPKKAIYKVVDVPARPYSQAELLQLLEDNK